MSLRHVPAAVAVFQWRAHRLARRINDDFSLVSATRPDKLKLILELARGRSTVVELGTATGWTAISLLLADPTRTVVTLDPIERATRELYLALAPRGARDRLRLLNVQGVEVPAGIGPIDFLYVDSSHEREATIAELEAWQPHLAQDALLVLDDFTHPDYPGVREAVRALRLDGEVRRGLFIARGGPGSARQPCAQRSARS